MTQNSVLEPFIAAADRALRAVLAPAQASRPTPVPASAPQNSLNSAAPESSQAAAASELPEPLRRESAALMRVNHAGEVAAQALYHGQALTARSAATRTLLLKAAEEEEDHLAWCEQRLRELDSRPSRLNPLWYAGSFAIGVAAGALGDRASLGFVAETERQVEGHLDEHLSRIPKADARSRAILEAMKSDEISHGLRARSAGGADLPTPIRKLMKQTARIMTHAAYWF